MNRFIYRSGNDNAGFTVIENIFINEYIPEAKGDYVKVYLFGLKNSQNPELEPLSTGELARILDLTESDILKAFDYWESKKLVRIEEQGPDTNIIFMNINSMMHYPAAVRKQEPVQKTSDPRFKQLVDTVQNMLGGGTQGGFRLAQVGQLEIGLAVASVSAAEQRKQGGILG